jgi:hypothetical protein
MVSNEDIRETQKVADIIRKVVKADAGYIKKEADAVYKHQPFMLSIMLGYQYDFEMHEMNELTRLNMMIWEYFKRFPNVLRKQVTQQQYERINRRNIEMLKYLDDTDNVEEFNSVVKSDLGKLKSKALFTGIHLTFATEKVLKEMDSEKRIMTIIGMKTLIECFEEIVFPSKPT